MHRNKPDVFPLSTLIFVKSSAFIDYVLNPIWDKSLSWWGPSGKELKTAVRHDLLLVILEV